MSTTELKHWSNDKQNTLCGKPIQGSGVVLAETTEGMTCDACQKVHLDFLGDKINEYSNLAVQAMRRNTGKMEVISPKPKRRKVQQHMMNIAYLQEALEVEMEKLHTAILGGCAILGLEEKSDGELNEHIMSELHWDLFDLVGSARYIDTLDLRKVPLNEEALEERSGKDTLTDWVVKSIQKHYHGRELCKNGDDSELVLYEAPQEVLEEEE